MSNGKLKVIIVGKLHLDPDIQQARNGMVVNLTIPTNEVWTDKVTGVEHKRTEWTRVAVFNRNAQIAAAYLRKGSGVYIEGTIRTEKFTDPKSGEVRYSSKAICQVLELTDPIVDAQGHRASMSVAMASAPEVVIGCSYSYTFEQDSTSHPGSYDCIQSLIR